MRATQAPSEEFEVESDSDSDANEEIISNAAAIGGSPQCPRDDQSKRIDWPLVIVFVLLFYSLCATV